MRRVAAVVQARMGSQRLPGKVLAPLPATDAEEMRVLDWVVRRLGRARMLDAVVVATSDTADDDALARHCSTHGYDVFRGSLADVLDRFRGAAASVDADVVVRVTADCPLVDPDVVDLVVRRHLAEGSRFTANRLPPPHRRTYPVGLDVEVTDMSELERAWHEAVLPAHREHVMPYLYEGGQSGVLVTDADVDAGDVRWTVDTVADLAAVTALIAAADARLDTGWRRLLDVWRRTPRLARLNAHVSQRTGSDVDPRRPT